MTAATQPSLEELVLGAIPWIPKVRLHNPFLSYENGDEFVQIFRKAAEGKLKPFILVVEGSIPDETNKEAGYWATFGTDPKTGTAHPHHGLDRLAGPSGLGGCGGGNVRGLRRNPRDGRKSHWLPGTSRLSWLGVEIRRRHSAGLHSGVSSSTGQYDADVAGTALHRCRTRSDDYSRRCTAPKISFQSNGPRGLRSGRLLRTGGIRRRIRFRTLHRQARLLGAGGSMQRWQAWLDGRNRRLPERGRNLHRLHHAWFPRQVHAIHGSAARFATLFERGHDIRPSHSRVKALHTGVPQSRAQLARRAES